ncbi:unnamed protein product [Schistosoma curassoni]|uniref:NADH dehydrogenase subunit 5 n=1 Tax=Schistosoma curassoni TaxID=6186 RepID=A0A183KJ29_9TREM|nr:unnamed protein product [Schistosoma curassoni]
MFFSFMVNSLDQYPMFFVLFSLFPLSIFSLI